MEDEERRGGKKASDKWWGQRQTERRGWGNEADVEDVEDGKREMDKGREQWEETDWLGELWEEIVSYSLISTPDSVQTMLVVLIRIHLNPHCTFTSNMIQFS